MGHNVSFALRVLSCGAVSVHCRMLPVLLWYNVHDLPPTSKICSWSFYTDMPTAYAYLISSAPLVPSSLPMALGSPW
ncbi:hypothetical protein PG987_004034 [Apiospora arundinis]